MSNFKEMNQILLFMIAILFYHFIFVIIFPNIICIWLGGGMTWILVAWVRKYYSEQMEKYRNER